MTELRRAPIEVLERLAEADSAWYGSTEGEPEPGWCEEGKAHFRALKAYRAAVAPLRTRAEVDADIVAEARAAFRDGHPHIPILFAAMRRLCDEPTQDSGPSSADTEEVPSPRPPVSPAGADLLQRVELLERYLGPSALEWARSQMPSGPAGVAAAKESKDNAAAPEGATKVESHACNPGDRECNCDQALHLERRIGDAVRVIRRSSLIAAGLRHELLGILEGEA